MSDAPSSRTARRGRLPLRRIAVVLGIWVVAAGGALLVASALDDPVGAGPRDEARPAVPGPLAVPGSDLADAGRLPPLALVLDRPPPQAVAALPPIRQPARLRELAAADSGPRRLVELGSVLQLLGDVPGARDAYQQALRRDPDDVAAQTGLAMTSGGDDGLARASAGLARLARSHPRDQLVAFNQGWVEIYRRRAAPAEAAWRRTVALGADTRLGRTATALLEALESGASGRGP